MSVGEATYEETAHDASSNPNRCDSNLTETFAKEVNYGLRIHMYVNP